MARRTLKAADLFCGAGGSSTGLRLVCESLGRKLDLVAVNHWQTAVETHAANHPAANHLCEDLLSLDPRKAVPGGKLDLLVASPECTHHSVARGGKPVNDQSRASAWCVLRWATALQVRRVVIENVREFESWGPIGLNGRPVKSRRGETFGAFVEALRSLGYRVEWRVLNAADYGDATTRQRLYIQAALGRLPIRWPAPTHAKDPRPGLFGGLERWRPARDVIDWNMPGESIFARKRPLSANTLRRIEAGLRKFGGRYAEPFLVVLRQHMDGRSVNDPLPTLTAGGTHVGLCEPFIVGAGGTTGQGGPRSVDDPLGTLTTENHRALVEPFTVHLTHRGGDRVNSVDSPLPTVTGANRGEQALVEPFVLQMSQSGSNGRRMRPTDEPIPTVTTADDLAVVEPFIVPQFAENGPRSVDQPLGTITTTSRGVGLVEPFIVPTNYGERPGQSPRCHDIDAPVPTVVAGGVTHGLVEPFIVPYCGTGVPDNVNEPLSTITTKDRLGLVQPQPTYDIRFRMLQPGELAAAMGFPRDYQFRGNRSEQVKQIGNAVAVNQAAALCSVNIDD